MQSAYVNVSPHNMAVVAAMLSCADLGTKRHPVWQCGVVDPDKMCPGLYRSFLTGNAGPQTGQPSQSSAQRQGEAYLLPT